MNNNQCSDKIEKASEGKNFAATGASNFVREMVDDFKCKSPCLPPGRGNEGSGALVFDNIFAQLDTNKDGQLSRDEFAAIFNPECHRPIPGPVPPPDAHIPGGEVPPGKVPPPDAHIPGGEVPPGKKPPGEEPIGNSNFSTRDGKIYDPHGKEFQPRGIDVDNMEYALKDIDNITGKWSANIIRVNPISQWDGQIKYDKELLDKVVDAYSKRGVVVEITDGLANHWGDLMNDKQIANHAQYYKELATQFKDNPYVWYASPNEAGAVIRPNTSQDKQWLKEELAMDNAIRSTGNKNIIVQGDAFWGQGATAGGESALVRHADEFQKFGNIVAGQHVYNDRPDAAALFNRSVDALQNKDFAVVVDEVSNWGQANGEPRDEISNGTRAVLDAVNRKDVGMLAFRWFEHNPDHTFNLTDGGRGQGALTQWGREVWQMTHGD